MKFIYCLNKEVAEDLEKSGLKKLGEASINGKDAVIFQNSKEIYINRYAKNTLFLSNQLFFTPGEK